ncbi:MAG: hypothetical protein HYR51_06600 [Candidatus Rokubacteria bacterium]|nr:hypothetical protein [Candidatus Rokubacteria bacterium]
MTARVLAVLLVALASAASAASVPADPKGRVAHHLREVEGLARHFEGVLAGDCPPVTSAPQWKEYVDGEVDRVVLLLAHLEQAWIEAKRTDDDDLRRTAKAPRQRADQARALVDKLQDCAGSAGQSLAPLALWRRIERELPKRQADIALPR